jgi:protein-S-isoprenylcysteine O-methyltransferase Ste14
MIRWICLADLVLALGISAHFRRKARRESGTIPRAREDPALKAARAVVGLPLLGGIVAYLADPSVMSWASYESPWWLRWMGVLLASTSVPAVYWTLESLGRNVSETVLTRDRHELVTHGPYRWVRHPLYSTGVALILGMGLAAASWFIVSMAAVVVLMLRAMVVPREEEALTAKFGEQYRDYRRRTGRLLPNRLRIG